MPQALLPLARRHLIIVWALSAFGTIGALLSGITESRLRLTYARVRELPAREFSDRTGDQHDPFEALADEDLESPLEALNRQDLLSKIEASLQPIEWTVLRMHYLEGLSGKEVADRLQLSAGRICQIHLRVLSRLKVRLASLQT